VQIDMLRYNIVIMDDMTQVSRSMRGLHETHH
jgi:hypothetical protein